MKYMEIRKAERSGWTRAGQNRGTSQELKAVGEALSYLRQKFKQEHPEVARYEKAIAYLAKHPDDKDGTKKELQQEQIKLVSEIAGLKVP